MWIFVKYGFFNAVCAALNVAEGRIPAACKRRHRHHERIDFLKQINVAVSFMSAAFANAD